MILDFGLFNYLCDIQVETKVLTEDDITNIDYILSYMFE